MNLKRFFYLLIFFLFLGLLKSNSVLAFNLSNLPHPLPYEYSAITYTDAVIVSKGASTYDVYYFNREGNYYGQLRYIHSSEVLRFFNSTAYKRIARFATCNIDTGCQTTDPDYVWNTNTVSISLGAGYSSNYCFEDWATSYDIGYHEATDFSDNCSVNYVGSEGDVMIPEGQGSAEPPEGGIPTFEFPINDGQYPISETFSFNGLCANIGENSLALLTRTFNYPESVYNITCDDDYTWQAEREITLGQNEFHIIDKNCVEENDNVVAENCYSSVYFKGYSADQQEFSISVDYPYLDESFSATVNSSDEFPLRFSYRTPDFDASNLTFKLLRFPDITYQGEFDSYANNSIGFFDENNYHAFEIPTDLTDIEDYYFQALLIDNEDILFTLNFKLTSVNDDSGQSFVPPDEKDLGFWGNLLRDLFVPPEHAVNSMLSDLKDTASEAVPFAYYYLVKDKFSNIEVSSEELKIDFDVDILNESINMPFLDLSDSQLDPVISLIRGLLVAFTWVMFGLYVLYRIFDFKF